MHALPPQAAAVVQPELTLVTGIDPQLWRTNLSKDLWNPESPDDVLTVFVEVGKTGSTTIKNTILDAVSAEMSSYCAIDLRSRQLAKGKTVRACSGSAIVCKPLPAPMDPSHPAIPDVCLAVAAVGAPFGTCATVSPGRRCQYLTSLREPGNRTVSEYNYFCRACAEGGKLCNADTGCPHVSFLHWARSHAEQFTQHFAPPMWPPTTRWIRIEDDAEDKEDRRSSYYYQYAHGFPDRPKVTSADYERALHVLSGKWTVPMLALKLEQLEVDGWERIEEFLGSPGLELRSHERKELHDRPKGNDYHPTQEEMTEVRETIHAFDARLYESLP